jgi:peptidylprolyl isomerase
MRLTHLLLGVLPLIAILGCGPKAPEAQAVASVPKLQELKIEDIEPGEGPAAEKGDKLYVLYTGTLANGTEFDSNAKGDKPPFALTLGAGQVIQGWDQGLEGVKKGTKRKISIPAKLGYGDQQAGTIPPNSDLYFDVQILEVLKPEDFGAIDVDNVVAGDGPAVRKGDTVVIKYKSMHLNGQVIDNSDDHGGSVTFKVGADEASDVIDLSVEGMKKGGKRKVTVMPGGARPAAMGADITPDTILVYEIELIEIK